MKRLWEKIVALAGSNFGLKVLALVIALGLWTAGHRDIERAIEVAVEFRNLPSDLMVVDNRVDYVVLRLNGPRTLVSTLDPDDMKLSLDLQGAKSGPASYPLSGGLFNLPRGITVARITPPVVHVRFDPVLRRAVPVTIKLSGKPSSGYRIVHSVAEPQTVSVSGPAEEVQRLASVDTLPIDVFESRGVIKRKVRLSNDGKPLTFLPDQVDVVVTIEEEEVSRDFSAVAVRAKDFAGAYTVLPSTVSLKISGAKSLLDKLELSGNEVFLSLKGLGLGDHNLPLMTDLPAGVRVVEQKPQRVRVRITRLAN
ncbi:MAG: YbbR-like domain-containing protein [Deltaproteobacteria bacterium]|nr:YbbR-like domain-containing protein [Deltaproteobacteria bacterium]